MDDSERSGIFEIVAWSVTTVLFTWIGMIVIYANLVEDSLSVQDAGQGLTLLAFGLACWVGSMIYAAYLMDSTSQNWPAIYLFAWFIGGSLTYIYVLAALSRDLPYRPSHQPDTSCAAHKADPGNVWLGNNLKLFIRK